MGVCFGLLLVFFFFCKDDFTRLCQFTAAFRPPPLKVHNFLTCFSHTRCSFCMDQIISLFSLYVCLWLFFVLFCFSLAAVACLFGVFFLCLDLIVFFFCFYCRCCFVVVCSTCYCYCCCCCCSCVLGWGCFFVHTKSTDHPKTDVFFPLYLSMLAVLARTCGDHGNRNCDPHHNCEPTRAALCRDSHRPTSRATGQGPEYTPCSHQDSRSDQRGGRGQYSSYL